MPGLRDIQREFSRAVLAPDAAGREDLTLLHEVRENNIAPARRLNVYRNNVQTNLTGALGSIYPVVEKLVGDGFFKYAAAEYITRHPSTSGDIRLFGARFADFIGVFEPARSLPYLPDIAALEWCYHESFHEQDAAGLDMEQLAAVSADDYPDLRFTLHPAARLIKSDYPVFQIWRANTLETEADQIIDLDAGAQYVLITRDPDSGDTELRALPRADFEFLLRLSQCDTLNAATDAALGVDAGFDLSGVIAEYVRNQTLVGFANQ